MTFFIQTIVKQNKLSYYGKDSLGENVYMGQTLYGDKVYMKTKFIRVQSLFRQSLYCDKVYMESKFIQTKFIL